jgi:hypothetical protein
VNVAEHGNAARLARFRDRADLTARRVRSRSLGMTEEANASGNALDMPTSVWSEMTRTYAEPLPAGKANDDRRPSVDASQSCCPKEHSERRPHISIAKRVLGTRRCPSRQPAGQPTEGLAIRGLEPYEGKLSSTVLRGVRAGNRPRLPGSRPAG